MVPAQLLLSMIIMFEVVEDVASVGIKRRMQEWQEQQEREEAAQQDDPEFRDSAASSSSSRPTLRGGIRQRIAHRSDGPPPTSNIRDYPLLDKLKKIGRRAISAHRKFWTMLVVLLHKVHWSLGEKLPLTLAVTMLIVPS